MRKKTAKRTSQRRTGSPAKKSGLIAKGKNSQRPARTKSALDNRSNRTSLQVSCERRLTSCNTASALIDLTVLTNQVPLPRSLLHAPVSQLPFGHRQCC
jgi:hypothetical protein